MLIAIVNRSTLVSNADIITMCKAIQIQLDLHFCPAWHMRSPTITFYTNETQVPGYAWTIYMIDQDSQTPGALGFHYETTDDKIDGYIMCQPILSNGGAVMVFDPANSSQYTVSATLSHEVCETVCDQFTNAYRDNTDGYSWCQEVCDPCEAQSYSVEVDGIAVSLSDFIYPAFFNPYATLPQNAPYNHLATIQQPFSLLSGGYAIVRTGGPGTEQQIFAKESTMPDWKRKQKSSEFARMNRRRKT